MKKSQLPHLLLEVLEDSGLDWSIEAGGKHFKIYVEGHLAGILPRGHHSSRDKRALLNTRSQIRRLVTALKGDD